MTQAELDFLTRVPKILRGIENELSSINEFLEQQNKLLGEIAKNEIKG